MDFGPEISPQVYWINHFPPNSLGGAENVTRLWNTALSEKANKRSVWYCLPPLPESQLPFPQNSPIRIIHPLAPGPARRFPSPDSVRKFISDVKSEQPEHIFFNYLDYAQLPLALALLGMGQADKTTFILHGDWFPDIHSSPNKSPSLSQALKPHVRYAARAVKKLLTSTILSYPNVNVLAVSQASADRAVELGLIPNPPPVCEPPSPNFNTEPVSPKTSPSLNRLPLQVKQIGRLASGKGILERFIPLAAAASERQLPVEFSLVGPASQDPVLNSDINKAAAGSVTLTGPRLGPELRQSLLNTDVAALLSDSEGSPLVLAEAASFGAALLGTRIPSIEELYSHAPSEVGALIDPQDQSQMINQGLDFLHRLVTFPDLLPKLSSAAILLSRYYSPDNLSQRFMQLTGISS